MSTINCASNFAIEVLPTPGLPISIGLFLFLLQSTLIKLVISFSLPMTGSSNPFFADSVKSFPYIERAFSSFSTCFVSIGSSLLGNVTIPFSNCSSLTKFFLLDLCLYSLFISIMFLKSEESFD